MILDSPPLAVEPASGLRTSYTLAAASGKLWLRVVPVDADVVRLWYSNSPRFVRKPSLALETAPKPHGTVRVQEGGSNVRLAVGHLALRVDKASLRVTVFDARSGRTIVPSLAVDPCGKGGTWSLRQGLAPEERLLGLGEDNRNGGRLDRRGTIRELWSGQQINSGNVTAEYPVPFMLSTGKENHAYGVFVDNVHRLRYDLGKTKRDEMKLDATGGEADFYVVDGPTPKDVVSRYTGLVGRPSLPALWSLGYWQSRCTFWDWPAMDDAYHGLRSRGYPVDVMVIDGGWSAHVIDYKWDKRWTVPNDPGKRIAEYGKKGVNIVISSVGPMIKKDSPNFPSGWKQGVFATDGKGHSVTSGYYGGELLDFTSSAMNPWLWPQLKRINDEGIDGWWLDLDEPEGEPPYTVYKHGVSADTHNQVSLLETTSFEASLLKDHPNQRPFILSRTGPAGIQRHHAAVWTGDIWSDYATLSAHPPEMLNPSLSGLTAWTNDTGGFLAGFYKDDRYGAHARLYERWMQFSAFCPITRAHKAGPCMPYEFGPATEQGTLKYIDLRYRLLPYIYSNDWQTSQTGIPLVRPMLMEFPNDPKALATPGDQYLFGPSLLVAPVLHEGVSNRPVYFPAGRWFDWDTGVEYTGGRTWTVAAPQNRIPVAVRAGAIIPMASPMANTAEVGAWDKLTLEVWPHGTSDFSVYRDDGRTFDYQKGRYTVTKLSSQEANGMERLTIAPSNDHFAAKRYEAHFHLDRVPAAVRVDGGTTPVRWDAGSRVLSVAFAGRGATRQTVEVRLAGPTLPRRMPPILKPDVLDAKGEARGGGRPTSHFFPSPALPARVYGENYDNGGEGVAFHRAHPVAAAGTYRPDDAGVMVGTRGLAGLQRDDWVRYTVDAGNGGAFDLVVHATGKGRFRLVSADRDIVPPVEITGGEVVIRNVYLNPGEDSLLLSVEQGGFALNDLEFRRAENASTGVEAYLALKTGNASVGKDETGRPRLDGFGQRSGSATVGIVSAREGAGKVRLRYANTGAKTIVVQLTVNGGKPVDVALPGTGGKWTVLDFPANFVAGPNRIALTWTHEEWDSATLQRIEIAP